MELVGRDAEIEHVRSRVETRALVTVTGPGGIGKTALVRAAFPDAPIADLTRVDVSEAVEDAIAGQLGYRDFNAFVDGWMDGGVIVVDNCEHVLDGAATAVAQMLTVPGSRILATSRTPLDLPGESILVVGPLDDPDSDFAHSVDVFLRAAVDAGLDTSEIDRDDVRAICRLLDGVPLALEIAAARLRTRSVDELRAEVESSMAGLVRPRFRGRREHAGVSEMVTGSLDLLDDTWLFDLLGIFAGPFSVEAAARISGMSTDAVRVGLDELVLSSLVVADTRGPAHFRMLHPVRAVAVQRLRATGRYEETFDRFCDYAAGVAADVVASSHRGWDSSALGGLLQSYDDFAAAVRWALDNDTEPDRAFLLLTVLWGVVHQIHAGEVEDLGTRALERWSDPATPGRSDVVSTVATCRILLGETASAEALIVRTLPYVQPTSYAASTLHRALAQAYRSAGRSEDARDAFRVAAEIAEELGAAGLAMESWVGYAMLCAEQGEFGRALDLIDQMIVRAREAHAGVNLAWAMTSRAAVQIRAGDADVEAAKGALEYSTKLGYPAGILGSLRILAMAHFALGDDAAGAAVLIDLVDELRRRGSLSDLRLALDLVAELAERRGDPAWEDLAATAAALPVTTVAAPVEHPLFERSQGAALNVRAAYRLAIRTLEAIRATEPMSPTVADAPGLKFRGDHWDVNFGGRVVSIRASKGMDDLAELLSKPYTEVAAVDLMDAGVVSEGTDELLDSSARRQYTERVRELQEEIEDAESFGDTGRAEKARGEMEALVEHLAAATGLGGRGRRTSGVAERARSAVTHRVRSTISRLGNLNPALGRHLDASIVTGAFCSYRPESPTRWRIER